MVKHLQYFLEPKGLYLGPSMGPSIYVQADNPWYNHYILHAVSMAYVIEAFKNSK